MKKLFVLFAVILSVSIVSISCKHTQKDTKKERLEKIAKGDKKPCCDKDAKKECTEKGKKECSEKDKKECTEKDKKECNEKGKKECTPNGNKSCCKDKKEKTAK